MPVLMKFLQTSHDATQTIVVRTEISPIHKELRKLIILLTLHSLASCCAHSNVNLAKMMIIKPQSIFSGILNMFYHSLCIINRAGFFSPLQSYVLAY